MNNNQFLQGEQTASLRALYHSHLESSSCRKEYERSLMMRSAGRRSLSCNNASAKSVGIVEPLSNSRRCKGAWSVCHVARSPCHVWLGMSRKLRRCRRSAPLRNSRLCCASGNVVARCRRLRCQGPSGSAASAAAAYPCGVFRDCRYSHYRWASGANNARPTAAAGMPSSHSPVS